MVALAIAASGMNHQNDRLIAVANSLANLNSAGFKEELPIGGNLGYSQIESAGSISSNNGAILPVGVQRGNGVKTMAIVTRDTQGTPTKTENPYHCCIVGKGYFQVELPSGETAYTRDGTFVLNQDGTLVTSQGYVVSPTITVPENATSVTINRNGAVSARIQGQAAQQNLGSIELATFRNENGLEKIENNLRLETAASGPAKVGQADDGKQGYGYIMQGHFESSNVDAITAITSLISIQRHFEYNVKAENAAKEMSETLNKI